MNAPLLVNRKELDDIVRSLGTDMQERKVAHAIRALGLRETESRKLTAPLKGREKLYFKEAAWAISALDSLSRFELAELHGLLDLYVAVWNDIANDGDYKERLSWIELPKDPEYWSIVLFAFNAEYGADPRLLARSVEDVPARLGHSSYGPDVMDNMVDAYLKASGRSIADLRQSLNLTETERRVNFTKDFIFALSKNYEDVRGEAASD